MYKHGQWPKQGKSRECSVWCVCTVRPVLVLVTDGGLVGDLAAASPLEIVEVDCGSRVDSASTAQGDRRSTWTRCRLWIVSQLIRAVMGV